MEKTTPPVTTKPIRFLLIFTLVLILLYVGKSLFVPLFMALLISFILYPFCSWLEKKKFSKLSAIFISVSISVLGVLLIVGLLSYHFFQFTKEWPALSVKVNQLIADADGWIKNSRFRHLVDQENGLIGSLWQYIYSYILPFIPKTIYQSSILLVLFLLIPIYTALILFYRDVLVVFLYKLFPSSASEKIKSILPDVIVTYYNFIKGMMLVYLIVGVLNSIGLAIIGIPNAIFFGFVASLLTFIPYVGITIGALLPMAVSWLMYDSVFYPIGVVVVFGIVQILEANVIFPLAVSFRLKINALMTLVVIIAGGILWGGMGMILFLPLAAILKLIADQVDELKPIAILFGTSEDIKEEDKV